MPRKKGVHPDREERAEQAREVAVAAKIEAKRLADIEADAIVDGLKQGKIKAAAEAQLVEDNLGAANVRSKDDLRTIEKRFLFVSCCCLGFIFLLSFIGQLLVHTTVKSIDTSSAALVVAGRQRMLAQQCAKGATAITAHALFPTVMGDMQVLRGALDKAVKEFVDHEFSLSQDPTIHTAKIDVQFKLAKTYFKQIKDNAVYVVNLVPKTCATAAGCEIQTNESKALVARYTKETLVAVNFYNPLMDVIVRLIQEHHDAVLDQEFVSLLYLIWALLGVVLV